MVKPFIFLILVFIHTVIFSQSVPVELRKKISQYGITWEFDKPMQSGQFVTGDWWVVGPATIVKIIPNPDPVSADNSKISINHWNDTSLKTGTTMRNGSSVVLKAGAKFNPNFQVGNKKTKYETTFYRFITSAHRDFFRRANPHQHQNRWLPPHLVRT